MDILELTAVLRVAGLLGIPVTNAPPHEDDPKRLIAAGTLEEYVETVLTAKCSAVFIYSNVLEESDFTFSPDDDDSSDEADAETAPVALDKIDPALAEFRSHLGQHGVLHLSTDVGSHCLDYVLTMSWWTRFLDVQSNAIDEWERGQDARQAQQDAIEEARNDDTVRRLHALENDPRFAKLPTQKAMLQYALRTIPELSDLDRTFLKGEIQELKAKIDSSGA